MNGRHDSGARRRSKRAGRERGCWIYIPAEQLERLGFKRGEPAPYYLTWPANGRPRLVVNFYREP